MVRTLHLASKVPVLGAGIQCMAKWLAAEYVNIAAMPYPSHRSTTYVRHLPGPRCCRLSCRGDVHSTPQAAVKVCHFGCSWTYCSTLLIHPLLRHIVHRRYHVQLPATLLAVLAFAQTSVPATEFVCEFQHTMSILRLSRCLQTAGLYLKAAAPSSSIFSSRISIESSSLALIGQSPATGARTAHGHSRLLPSSSSRAFGSALALSSAAAYGSMGISADERPFTWLLQDTDSRHSAKPRVDSAADGSAAAGQHSDIGKPHRTQRITEIRGPYHDVVGRRRLSVSSLLVSAHQPSSVVAATCCPC